MAVALVVNTGAGGTSSTVTTTAKNTTGANLIVLVVCTYTAVVTPTDSKSNSWTMLTSQAAGTGVVAIWYCLSPTTDTSHTFTVATANRYPSVCMLAFSGVNSYHTQNGATNSGVTTLSCGSVTPIYNGSLIVAGLGLEEVISSLSINASLTITDQVAYSAGNHYGVDAAYYIQPTAGAINPAWSWTTNAHCGAVIADYRATPAPGAINTRRTFTGNLRRS